MKNVDNSMFNRELVELQKELENLTIEFNRRASKINERLVQIQIRQAKSLEAKIERDRSTDNNNVGEIEEVFADEDNTIHIGSIVEITNSYKGKKGIQGEVTKINRSGDRCTLKDSSGNLHIRAPWNLKKL